MKELGHHLHLVNLLGCSTNTPASTLIVLEFCANGDLLHFLRTNKNAILEVEEQKYFSTFWTGY
jgi:serine/threonine protein kinase